MAKLFRARVEAVEPAAPGADPQHTGAILVDLRNQRGGEISVHTDSEASFYIHKIHVPLITNDKTMFRVGQKEEHLPVGEIVEVNNKRSHGVRNDGGEDRIHLIFECFNADDYGKS